MILLAPLLAFAAAVAPAAPALPREARAAPVTPAAVAEGNRRFALDLYRRLAREERGNIFFSPVSLGTAFGPLAAGAGGNTLRAIADTLGYPASGPALHSALGGLGRSLERESDGITLAIANALWLDRRFAPRPAFLATSRGDYDASVETLDFRQADAAAARINAWSGEKTRGRIPQLVTAEDLPPGTGLVVTNAVYFLADWAAPFAREATRALRFTLGDGGRVVTPMMGQTGGFRHVRGRGFAALDLPYRDPRFTMTLLLPDAADGLPALERALSPALLTRTFVALDRAEEARVELLLPKLELRTDYRLGDALRAMGLAPAFARDADFSGISETPVMIGQVIHKTFLRVDEKGTEAAAATAIVAIVVSGMRRDLARPIQFHADRPFLILLRDRETGAILFFGRIVRPEVPA
jgi:serpin B